MNNNNLKTIAISGANGFIGSYLYDYFINKSYNIIAYTKENEAKLTSKGVSNIKFDLKNPHHFKLQENIDFFIHCAYLREDTDNLNLKAVKIIKAECENKKVKFVFLSSMSAKENALSNYGKNKFKIENALNPEEDLILRLGLVIGDGGLFKSLSKILKKNKIIPLIGSGKQQLQTVGIEQLTEIIELLIIKNRSGVYTIAEENAVLMKEFYIELSKAIGSKNIFIPIPYFISDAVFNIINILNLKIGIDKENYLGLKAMKKENTNIEKELDIGVLDYKKSIKLAST